MLAKLAVCRQRSFALIQTQINTEEGFRPEDTYSFHSSWKRSATHNYMYCERVRRVYRCKPRSCCIIMHQVHHAGTSQNDLVGKAILHKFILESGEEKWFSGVIVGYNWLMMRRNWRTPIFWPNWGYYWWGFKVLWVTFFNQNQTEGASILLAVQFALWP